MPSTSLPSLLSTKRHHRRIIVASSLLTATCIDSIINVHAHAKKKQQRQSLVDQRLLLLLRSSSGLIWFVCLASSSSSSSFFLTHETRSQFSIKSLTYNKSSHVVPFVFLGALSRLRSAFAFNCDRATRRLMSLLSLFLSSSSLGPFIGFQVHLYS